MIKLTISLKSKKRPLVAYLNNAEKLTEVIALLYSNETDYVALPLGKDRLIICKDDISNILCEFDK